MIKDMQHIYTKHQNTQETLQHILGTDILVLTQSKPRQKKNKKQIEKSRQHIQNTWNTHDKLGQKKTLKQNITRKNTMKTQTPRHGRKRQNDTQEH